MLKLITLLSLLGFSAPAQAHPHVFIDAGLHFLCDDKGKLAAVRVVWAYDEFYSLLMLEERQLDPDGDGVLTEAELQSVAGTDVDWTHGFSGDLELRTASGELIELGRPLAQKAAYEDGRLITSHIRPLTQPRRPDQTTGISAKVFDPTYFVAYDLRREVRIETDPDCEVAIITVDKDKAMQQAAREYSNPDAYDEAQGIFPEVGEFFADNVVLTCASSS